MPDQAAAGEIPQRRECCNSAEDVGHDFTCPTMLAAAGVEPPTRVVPLGLGHMIVDAHTAAFLEAGPTEQQLRGAISETEEQLGRGFRWEAEPVITPYLTKQERTALEERERRDQP